MPRTVRSLPLFLLVALGLLGPGLAGCDVPAPAGEWGAQYRARFFHALEGPLGGGALAVGTRLVMAARLDDCDSLRFACDDEARLDLVAEPASVLDLQLRSDGLFGVSAVGPGRAVLRALDGEGNAVDVFTVDVERVARVGLTDQPPEARAPRALPLDFGVSGADTLDLRVVLVGPTGRVLLSGGDDRTVVFDVREGEPVLEPLSAPLNGHVRLRPGAVPTRNRFSVYPVDGSVEDASLRIFVGPPTGDGRVLIDVHHIETQPGFGVVSIDLCAVRDFDGHFQVGHDFLWGAPQSFAIRDLGLGAFANEPPEGSRCVRAVRYEDREVASSERFGVLRGSAQAFLPMGVVLGRVRQVKPWYGQAWDFGTGVLSGDVEVLPAAE